MLWFIYRVKVAVSDIDCMHETIHAIEERVETIGEMLSYQMDHFRIPHPDDEVPNAPDLSALVNEWDNKTEHGEET